MPVLLFCYFLIFRFTAIFDVFQNFIQLRSKNIEGFSILLVIIERKLNSHVAIHSSIQLTKILYNFISEVCFKKLLVIINQILSTVDLYSKILKVVETLLVQSESIKIRKRKNIKLNILFIRIISGSSIIWISSIIRTS